MSTLTEEQRRRMEENRRKALERRAAASSNGNLAWPNKSNSSLEPKPIFKNTVVPQKTNTFPVVKSMQPSTKNDAISAFKKTLFHSSDTNSTSNGKNVTVPTEVIKGACVLISRVRFAVDICYNKELIELFKSVSNRLYDIQTKRWNFLIEDHDKLMSMVKSLQPGVLIAHLPKFIIKTFAKAPEKRVIKEHDLSRLDPVMLNALLPFQKDGVNFAIEHDGRVLIADDMGLGKTIQAIAVTNYYSEDWPLLVVTPSSVRYSWEEAFHTWLPSLDPQEISIINSGKDHIPKNKVILMSYDLLTKMKDAILTRKFRSIIFDESHFLKNPKSARTKAALEIMKRMNRIILLSGTPALSRPIELFTQLSALKQQNFFSYMEYGVRYCNGNQTQWGWDFNGSSKMEELQIVLEEILMIRRLKSDVIKQLPPKFRQMIILDPSRVCTKSKVLKAMHNKMQQKGLSGMERRGVLLEYFHETGEVKLIAVCEYILDLLEGDKKFVCFAHHQSVLNGISRAIEEKNVDYIRIDGSVSSEQRKKLCDKFQLDVNCKVAVLSITSANCGITLTAASLVVFAELFWNPGILTQAEDRTHRIGQEDSVVVQYLVAKNTADDEIWPLVQRKLDILNKAGLSKDNFKSADTIVREDMLQSNLDDFWVEMNDSMEMSSLDQECDIPDKRLKLDI